LHKPRLCWRTSKSPLTWTERLKRTARETQNDNGAGLAAQLAYYFFLALFPALLFMLAMVSFYNDLELLRVRLQKSRPTSQDAIRVAQRVLPVLAGTAGVWWWSRRRRSVDSLDALLVHALDELYQGEQELVPALHRMAAEASDPELKKAFETHAVDTGVHVDRLQRVFRAIGTRPRRRGTAEGLAGIIADSDHLLKRKVDPDVRDAWLIATAQRIEHVEISAYGTARTYAEMLGLDKAARLLQETLEEERATDEKLTRIARGFVNPQSIRSAVTH
jgi:ferritin-like metal-binding protein YciE